MSWSSQSWCLEEHTGMLCDSNYEDKGLNGVVLLLMEMVMMAVVMVVAVVLTVTVLELAVQGWHLWLQWW